MTTLRTWAPDSNVCQACPFCESSGSSITLLQTPLHPQTWSKAQASDHSSDPMLLNMN